MKLILNPNRFLIKSSYISNSYFRHGGRKWALAPHVADRGTRSWVFPCRPWITSFLEEEALVSAHPGGNRNYFYTKMLLRFYCDFSMSLFGFEVSRAWQVLGGPWTSEDFLGLPRKPGRRGTGGGDRGGDESVLCSASIAVKAQP